MHKCLLPSILLAMLLLLAPSIRAEDEETPAPAPYAVGDKVEALSGAGMDGKTVGLADMAITPEKAAKTVLALAREYGAAEDATLEVKVKDLSGMKDEDGDFDTFNVEELMARAGQPYGLVPPEDAADEIETLDDIAGWIRSAVDSPILLMLWSPRCPACIAYDERVAAIVAETRTRLVAIAASHYDKPADHLAPYLKGNYWHWFVILDPYQGITDRFGGEVTPEVYLLDKDHTLRYTGAVDNDMDDILDEEERKDWLADAIRAVKAGETVSVTETEPAGCPIKRKR